jgi:hypothetical protein
LIATVEPYRSRALLSSPKLCAWFPIQVPNDDKRLGLHRFPFALAYGKYSDSLVFLSKYGVVDKSIRLGFALSGRSPVKIARCVGKEELTCDIAMVIDDTDDAGALALCHAACPFHGVFPRVEQRFGPVGTIGLYVPFVEMGGNP